jgi:AcrR family transcriptional regulator
MQVHRPLAERRRQLVEAGLAIAEREGTEALTVRRVAAEAGVSLGLMYHCFATKDELTVAMATRIVEDLAAAGDAARADVHGPAAALDVGSVLRAALVGLWLEIERTPGRQLLTYEITTRALREPGLGGVAQRQYAATVALAGEVLARAAGTAGVTWARDLDELAGIVVMAVDGATLRWLVDHDSDGALTRLGAIADLLATMTHQP